MARCYDAVKSLNPTVKFGIGGVPSNKPSLLNGMIVALKEMGLEGLKMDFYCYHQYTTDVDGQNGNSTFITGVSPESGLTRIQQNAQALRYLLDTASPDQYIPIYVTETGYSIAPSSPPGFNQQYKAKEFPDRTSKETQGDWLVRSSILLIRWGADVVMWYQLYPDPNAVYLLSRPNTQFPDANYTEWDTTNPVAVEHVDIFNEDNNGGELRSYGLAPATFASKQILSFCRGYRFDSAIQEVPGQPWIYKFVRPGKALYAVWMPTEDRLTQSVAVPVGNNAVTQYYIEDYSETPTTSTIAPVGGVVTVTAEEKVLWLETSV